MASIVNKGYWTSIEFPVFCCPKPLFQSEAKCEAIDMKTSFILMKMKLIST